MKSLKTKFRSGKVRAGHYRYQGWEIKRSDINGKEWTASKGALSISELTMKSCIRAVSRWICITKGEDKRMTSIDINNALSNIKGGDKKAFIEVIIEAVNSITEEELILVIEGLIDDTSKGR